MGKPSSNNANSMETPSSINSLSSKMSGLANGDILDATPKLSLNLRPKGIQSEQQRHLINKDNNATEAYHGPNMYSITSDNNYTINNHNGKDFSPSHQNDTSRIPLPMTEIEPSWSRDSYINTKEKKKTNAKGKHAVDTGNKQKDTNFNIECAH